MGTSAGEHDRWVVPARPVQRLVAHDRRQRRHERRGAVLREGPGYPATTCWRWKWSRRPARSCASGGAPRKGVAGYDLVGLAVDSKGTLGAVTEVTVRLQPSRSAPTRTVVGLLDTVAACGAAVARVTPRGLEPGMFELIRRHCLAAVNEWETHQAARRTLSPCCSPRPHSRGPGRTPRPRRSMRSSSLARRRGDRVHRRSGVLILTSNRLPVDWYTPVGAGEPARGEPVPGPDAHLRRNHPHPAPAGVHRTRPAPGQPGRRTQPLRRVTPAAWRSPTRSRRQHLDNDRRLLAGLTLDEQHTLAHLLRTLRLGLERHQPTPTPSRPPNSRPRLGPRCTRLGHLDARPGPDHGKTSR